MQRSRINLQAWIIMLMFTSLFLNYSCARQNSIPDTGWPQANGPYGNFNPARYGCTLVNDMAAARKVWTSEDNDLGYAKTLNSIFLPRAVWPGHPGSSAGLIVADGKVFTSSFRPAGDVWAETQLTPYLAANWSPELLTRLKQNLRIDADDIMTAIDATTGKTLWKTIEERKGINRGMRKWNGWGVTPVYYDGKVFSMGTTGRLYAYDANTGKKVWEINLNPLHRQWEAEKQQHLQEKTLPDENNMVSLIVADGILVVPLFNSIPDIGLRGVNPSDGKTLWELPAVTYQNATPAIWHHTGHEYILTATNGDPVKHTGKMFLISPKDGKILWTVDNLADTYFSLAPSDKTVLVNVGSGSPGKDGKPWIVLGAYRLGLKGAERAWTMPENLEVNHEFNSEDWRKYLIRDGKVYYNSRSFFIFDEETGNILYPGRGKDATRGPAPGQIYLVEDKILHVPDAWHGARVTMQLWTADPQDFRRLGSNCVPPHTSTTAYNTFMEFPYVEGRIFMRAQNGIVVCYDLRQPVNARSLSLRFNKPYVNKIVDQPPLKAVLWVVDGKAERGFIAPDTVSKLQNPLAGYRRNISVNEATLTDTGLTGSFVVDVGFHTETWDVQLTRTGDDFQGNYERRIDPLPDSFIVRGDIRGTKKTANESKTIWTLKLTDALSCNSPQFARRMDLLLLLEPMPDGQWRCIANVPAINKTDKAGGSLDLLLEPEVDASKLSVEKDRLHGEITVIFRDDIYKMLNSIDPKAADDIYKTVYFGRTVAPKVATASYQIDATVRKETVTGRFEGIVGHGWSHSGTLTGKYVIKN